MPRTGAYIIRTGSFEATITASEGNITFGHSGSVKFIDAASGSIAELTSSISGSTMQTEWILGERTQQKPFWVFKPDGKIQYSKGGTTKVTEIDMSEKFLISSRSAHDSTNKFEHYEIEERAADEKKAKVKGGQNTYDKGLIVSGTAPFLSLFKTDTGALTQVNHNRYFYVSSSYPWNIGQVVSGVESYFGGQAGISLSSPPTEFWFSASGDFWTKGTISGSELNIGGSQVTSNNVTVNRDLIVNRNIDVGTAITHIGDGDTKIAFTTDTITFDAGGVEMLKFTEGGLGNVIVVNEDGADTNFRIESSGTPQMLFVDGGTNKVGISAGATPSKTLTVGGDISASGEYFGKWKTTSTHAFYVTNASVNFVPMAASLNESSVADSYYHRQIAPYNGRLVRVMAVCQNNDPGSVSIGLATGSGALGLTKDNGEICTIHSCVDDTSYTFDFSSSRATFNKGEDIGIQFQQSNTVANGTYITVVWEYDSGGT